MLRREHQNRRRERTRGFRLKRSIFLDIPVPVSIAVLSSTTMLVQIADYMSAGDVWLGPVYLLLVALSAWLVGKRFAIALGLAVISFNLVTGNNVNVPFGAHALAVNFLLKFSCVLFIALLLGIARNALEREWRLARTDMLTGALNRQAFFEAIAADADRQGPTLLVFADVDGLKRLNDERGHELGDASLKGFANRVRKAIRKSDLFARMGGDEFVIFMKIRDQAAATAIANRLHQVLNLDCEADQTALQCSLGVLFLPEGSRSIDVELKLSDELMYMAKKARAGVCAALASEVDGQTLLSSSITDLPPADRKPVLRSRDRQLEDEVSGR